MCSRSLDQKTASHVGGLLRRTLGPRHLLGAEMPLIRNLLGCWLGGGGQVDEAAAPAGSWGLPACSNALDGSLTAPGEP